MNVLIVKNSNPTLKAEYNEKHFEQIKSVAPNIHIEIVDPEKKTVDRYLPKADILIVSRFNYLDYVDFSKASNLKWVHLSSAGSNEIAASLKELPIILTNSSGVSSIPIAEHVFTYILMCSRQFLLTYRIQIEKRCWFQNPEILQPTELYQKTIGIVGYGRVGKRIAKIAKGFNMSVFALAHNKEIQDINVDFICQKTEFNKLLNSSDYIINCLPLTHETENFFTLQQFRQMKPSAYFINVGRGKTVVEEDLVYALKENIIAGAGLDVFYKEPLPAAEPLWDMKNVIITPHYAGCTPFYTDRVVDIFCSNLRAFLDHQPMPNFVNKECGY